MRSSSIFTAAVLFGSAMATGQEVGCYSSSLGTTFKDSDVFNAKGGCANRCDGFAAFAMQGDMCYCGDMTPPDSDKVDDSKCNSVCPGFPEDRCGGGDEFFSFYNAGLVNSLPEADKSEVTTSTSSTTPSATKSVTSSATSPVTPLTTSSAGPANTTIAAPTTLASSGPTPIQSVSSANSNVAGVAAGVIVGIFAMLV